MYTLASSQEVQLLIDTWEGQPKLPLDQLTSGNVAGVIMRLNDMKGGHHLDTLFTETWDYYKDFLRAPYFVYNPWVSGTANYAWLRDHMPEGCPCVMADIEVRYTDYSPDAYASQVADFISLAALKWTTKIYTGQWFLPYLSFWPKNVGYWWAQYPYSMYPSSSGPVTWEQLRAMIKVLKWPPVNASTSPATVELWQCSGDRLILPGSTRSVDINLFPGSFNQLKAWLGYPLEEIPIPLTWEQSIDAWARGLGFDGPKP